MMILDASDFFFACRCGDLDDVKETIEFIKVKDESGNTGLHFASANGHPEIVDFLLKQGADPNIINGTGNTCLHWAALNGHLSIVEMLLEKGVQPELKNDTGRSAATLAEQQGHHDCVNKIWLYMKDQNDDEDNEKEEEEVTFGNNSVGTTSTEVPEDKVLDIEPSSSKTREE